MNSKHFEKWKLYIETFSAFFFLLLLVALAVVSYFSIALVIFIFLGLNLPSNNLYFMAILSLGLAIFPTALAFFWR